MSTITNQTLTLTITSGSVDTVIRKDNCRVDTFGDYVRLTDYTGERYEFLFSDITSPSTASAVELAEAIEDFLNTGGGGGGGGVETVTGGLVDNTDPGNPVVSVQDGAWTPSVSATNDASVSAFGYYQYSGGKICHFSMQFDIAMDAGQSDTEITISDLPIPTTFTNGRQALIGICNGDNYNAFLGCSIVSAGANLVLSVSTQNNGEALQKIQIVGHYEVL